MQIDALISKLLEIKKEFGGTDPECSVYNGTLTVFGLNRSNSLAAYNIEITKGDSDG